MTNVGQVTWCARACTSMLKKPRMMRTAFSGDAERLCSSLNEFTCSIVAPGMKDIANIWR